MSIIKVYGKKSPGQGVLKNFNKYFKKNREIRDPIRVIRGLSSSRVPSNSILASFVYPDNRGIVFLFF